MNNKNIHVSGAIVCTHYVFGYQVENQPLSLDIKRYKKNFNFDEASFFSLVAM